MSLRAVDCQGFAGGFTLGVVQAGFELIAKREMKGGFGVKNCEANRHLLGERWDVQACDPMHWHPWEAELVFGNPPCSGFSTLSPKSFRGMDSKINDCMWAFVEYAARCRPQVAIFESVQPAYKKGRELMQKLRLKMEETTGERWALHHVLHNNLSVGGGAQRKRYFWLVSKVPFGIEVPDLEYVPSLGNMIGDLATLDFTWEPQPYKQDPTWWSHPRRREDGLVDGHAWWDGSSYIRKSLDLNTEDLGPWPEGERLQNRLRLYYETYGDLPESWSTRKASLLRGDFWCGASQLTRWRWNDPARVITGAGLESVLHAVQDRGLTHREVARIMGFPDSWLIEPLESAGGGIRQTWGKGIPVDSGRWIAEWARRAIEGTPGTDGGEPIGDNEYLIDVTNSYKRAVVA